MSGSGLMTNRMTNISEVVDNFVGLSEREQALLFAIRDALRACTSGEHVSRAYRTQEILETALARYGDGD